MSKKRYLVLEDGTVFEGEAFGADESRIGELVFTTGMCGYIETLTDPSYFGQIVLQTFPMIGNYGIINADFEGKCCVSGYVVRECCDAPSNFRLDGTLHDYLSKNGVPGICGVDTRAITKKIREHGVMNAVICDSVPSDLKDVKNYTVKDAVKSVTGKNPIIKANLSEENLYNVVLLDYGAKNNISEELLKRNCKVKILPATASAEEILKEKPDGIMLSNGPGDPAENVYEIEQIKKLFGKTVIFGICLGHQLLALSQGAKTQKMKYGHRGVNQPVRETEGKRTYITSQNHGYAVIGESLKRGKVSFVNANDGTVEGIEYAEDKAFSVQFHPEANSGPHDTEFLFDKFCKMMEENKDAT